ncbi:unnamed protein product [Absidia cylindrospora]
MTEREDLDRQQLHHLSDRSFEQLQRLVWRKRSAKLACGTRTIANIHTENTEHKTAQCRRLLYPFWQQDVDAARNIQSCTLFTLLGFMPSVSTNHLDKEYNAFHPPQGQSHGNDNPRTSSE